MKTAIVRKNMSDETAKKVAVGIMDNPAYLKKLFFKSKWLEVAPVEAKPVAEGAAAPAPTHNLLLHSDTYVTGSARHRLTKAEKKKGKRMLTAYKLELARKANAA